ncbi:Holliday junction resolvase RecU [Candidatus Phytoplasma prunorum]|uniref:Holliday junction resolvase RecU n=1 Tax=Candidatus Phytoplasma prunorum TaxID=47565 RepID=UPI002FF08910
MKYPTINKKNKIQKNNNKSNLGMSLEKNINITNKFYLDNQIAFIYKNPIPIQIVKVNYPSRNKAKITEAYFRKEALPDYHGLYKGKYITFDVKETNCKTSYAFSNIPLHQIKHLQQINNNKGLAFFIVHFKINDKYFLIPINLIIEYLQKGFKSIKYKILLHNNLNISFQYNNPRINYLKIVDQLLK